MDPNISNSNIYGCTKQPTGCFSFKALFNNGKPKTPLVLRKSKSNKYEVVGVSETTSSSLQNKTSTTGSSHSKHSSREKHFLPDVVATATTEAKPKHRLKDFEDLEAENDRLKAIFQMHSIKISEKTRRNSQPDKAGLTAGELLPCDNTKRSSMSSDSSSTKYEDVKTKRSDQRRKKNTKDDHGSKRLSSDSSGRENKETPKATESAIKETSTSTKEKETELRLTSSEVAQALLQHKSDKKMMTTASGSSSSLPSTPQSLRRSSHSSTNSHGGSLNNIISPQERRGSKGIIKPSVQRTRIVTDRDHLQTKVGYSNYHFFDSCSRPGFVFIGSSGHVIAECSGHPSNNKIIVKTVREASDEVEDGEFFEEEFDEEKIYASQKLRTISLKFESLKG